MSPWSPAVFLIDVDNDGLPLCESLYHKIALIDFPKLRCVSLQRLPLPM